jgi:hypothetical protein
VILGDLGEESVAVAPMDMRARGKRREEIMGWMVGSAKKRERVTYATVQLWRHRLHSIPGWVCEGFGKSFPDGSCLGRATAIFELEFEGSPWGDRTWRGIQERGGFWNVALRNVHSRPVAFPETSCFWYLAFLASQFDSCP